MPGCSLDRGLACCVPARGGLVDAGAADAGQAKTAQDGKAKEGRIALFHVSL